MRRRFSIGDTLTFAANRPDRDLVLKVSEYYSVLVASFITVILLATAFQYVPLWTLCALSLYWVYQLGKGAFERSGILGQPYISEQFQIVRSVALILVVTAFLLLVYSSPGYLDRGSPDTLWLLYILAIFIVSQYSHMLFVVITLALASFGLLTAYAFTSQLTNLNMALIYISEVAWLTLLTMILHILMRFADFRADNLRALHDLEQNILRLYSEEDETKILQNIVEEVATAYAFPYVSLFAPQLETGGGLLCIASATHTRNLAREHFVLEPGLGIIGHVAHTGVHYLSNDTTVDPHYYAHEAFPGTKSEFAIPLMAAGRLIGVLDIEHTKRDAFSLQHEELILLMASHISTFLSLRRQAEAQEPVSELIKRITKGYFSQRELADTLHAITQAAQQDLGADLVLLFRHNPATGETALGSKFGSFKDEEHLEKTIEGQRQRMHEFLAAEFSYYFHPDVSAVMDPLFLPSEDFESRGYEPFYVREGVISRATLRLDTDLGSVGLMFLNFRTRRSFKEQESLFHIFAHLAAWAIQKAQLQEEAVVMEREKITSLLHQDIKDKLNQIMGHVTLLHKQETFSVDGQETMGKIRRQLEEVITSARFLHRTQVRVFGGLRTEIKSQIEAAEQIFHETQFRVEWQGDPDIVPHDVAVCAATIMRGLLLNVGHGGATEVDIIINVGPKKLLAQYADNGRGFGKAPDLTRYPLTGLAHIHEEARRVGGQVDVVDPSSPGARVRITLPFAHRVTSGTLSTKTKGNKS